MTDQIEPRPVRRLSGRTALAAIALLGAGGAVGATMDRMAGPSIEVAPLSPVSIASLKTDEGLVTVRGKVGEVYGSSFVLVDGSGRTLVDMGPRGSSLIAAGAPVTIQGWNRNGVVRASFLVGANGKVTALGPMGRRPHGRHGPHGGAGGPDRDGPDGPGRDGPPPPAAAPVAPAPG
ncbi:MAG: hypothetical protein JWN66_1300 [Sphingomonas bacterium]|uniref:hypothetical protein n=1 Tax=Sphingomonas bacterium TaxID=1895847 RepID=UPI002636ED53|nr:hypothetical protein [Sphingomonas bacterium]MDB5704184.1 hypothetical protein [Sphingomonas bacterium]